MENGQLCDRTTSNSLIIGSLHIAIIKQGLFISCRTKTTDVRSSLGLRVCAAAGRRFGAALGKPAGRLCSRSLDDRFHCRSGYRPRVEKDTHCTVSDATSLEYGD